MKQARKRQKQAAKLNRTVRKMEGLHYRVRSLMRNLDTVSEEIWTCRDMLLRVPTSQLTVSSSSDEDDFVTPLP